MEEQPGNNNVSCVLKMPCPLYRVAQKFLDTRSNIYSVLRLLRHSEFKMRLNLQAESCDIWN